MIYGLIFGVKYFVSKFRKTMLQPLIELLYSVSAPVVLQFTGCLSSGRKHERVVVGQISCMHSFLWLDYLPEIHYCVARPKLIPIFY